MLHRLRLPRIRSRNRFVAVLITLAIIAVVGALVVFFVFVNKPAVRTRPPPVPPKPPEPVRPFEGRAPEPWVDAKPSDPRPGRSRPPGGRSRPRPSSLQDSAISTGIRKLSARFNRCAQEHGGVDGSVVRVGFSVNAEGRVTESSSLSPHQNTPLGRCIANSISSGRFGRSEQGRSDIRWSITLHP